MRRNLLQETPLMQQAYDAFLRTLCNRTRLAITQALLEGPRNVTWLTDELGIHQSSVSHGLKRLLECGFVHVTPNGKERIYTINKKTIMPLMNLMRQHVDTYCTKRCCKGGGAHEKT